METLHDLHFHNKGPAVFVDLKPDNIMWSSTKGRWNVVDFGSLSSPFRLSTFSFNGTPAYASSRSLLHGGSRTDDDLQSLVFTLEWTLNGDSLPWFRELDYPTIVELRKSYPFTSGR